MGCWVRIIYMFAIKASPHEKRRHMWRSTIGCIRWTGVAICYRLDIEERVGDDLGGISTPGGGGGGCLRHDIVVGVILPCPILLL